MIAAAMSTLYSFTPKVVLTKLLSATVTVWFAPVVKDTPNRKSFHICVNWKMTVTMMIGGESGRMMWRKVRKKPAPSILADLISSSGTPR